MTEIKTSELRDIIGDFKQFDYMLDGVIIADLKGKAIRVNKAFLKLTGYKNEDVVGKTPFFMISLKEVPKLRAAIKETQRKGSIRDIDINLIRKDKKSVPVGFNGVMIKDKNGKPKGFLVIIREMTDYNKNFKELQELEERYKLLFEFAPDAYYLNDLRGLFIDGNKKAEELTGYKREELIGKNFLKLKLISKEDIPRATAALAKSVLGKPTGPDEFIITRKDGKKVWVEIMSYPVKVKGSKLVLGIAREITKRKQMEEDLKESEEKYRTLFSESVDAIMTLEPPDWSFTSGNSATVQMFKTGTEKKFISSAPYKLSPEYQPDGQSSKTKAFEMINKAMKDGKNFFEWTHLRADGQEFQATVLLTRVEIEKGKPFLLATVRDITERKKAEENIRLFFRSFEKALNPKMVVKYVNKEPKIVQVNDSFLEFYGFNTAEVIGQNPRIIASGKIKKEYYKRMWASILDPKKGFWHSEIIDRKKDGTLVYVDLSVSTLFDRNGKVEFFVAEHLDITKRVQAEELVLEEKNFSDNVTRSLPGAFFIFNSQQKLLKWNKNIEKITNYSKEEMGKIKPPDLFEEEMKKIVGEKIKLIFENKKQQDSLELNVVTKDGKKIPFYMTGVRVEKNKEPFIAVMGLDLTNIKRVESALKSSEDRYEFISMISHQLRTPVSAARGLLEVMEGQDNTGNIKEAFYKINSLNDIIGTLLFYLEQKDSESGRKNRLIELDLVETIKEQVLLLTDDIKDKKIVLLQKLPSKLKIKSNQVILNRVIYSVIHNAVAYNKEHGNINVSIKKDKSIIRIKVKDTGYGIPQDEQHKVFSEYFRASNASLGKNEGSGLSLFLAATMMQLLGGSIGFESTEGEGSEFWIELPIVNQ